MLPTPPPSIICVIGPTGTGKTDFSLSLAESCNGEIINCDIGQMYTPLTIGTAKPAWRTQSIRHHLFDILDTPEHYSAAAYRQDVLQAIAAIRASGKRPIIVGGSLFYCSVLFFPPHEETTPSTPTNTDYARRSWEELAAIDPERAQAVHPHDTYRISRAFAMLSHTGALPSRYKPVYHPIEHSCSIIYLTRSRDDLYRRINSRVETMLADGWLEEIARLNDSWRDFILRKKLIGYNELLTCISQQSELSQSTIACIQQRTRKYAKRQETFWRSLKRKLTLNGSHHIRELHLTLSSVDLYLKELAQRNAI